MIIETYEEVGQWDCPLCPDLIEHLDEVVVLTSDVVAHADCMQQPLPERVEWIEPPHHPDTGGPLMRRDQPGTDELLSDRGPYDQQLRALQHDVEQAEDTLDRARKARAAMIDKAHRAGYSVYWLGRLTGNRKAPAVHNDLKHARQVTA